MSDYNEKDYQTIKNHFSDNPENGRFFSNAENTADFWEGEDSNGEQVLVNLTAYQWQDADGEWHDIVDALIEDDQASEPDHESDEPEEKPFNQRFLNESQKAYDFLKATGYADQIDKLFISADAWTDLYQDENGKAWAVASDVSQMQSEDQFSLQVAYDQAGEPDQADDKLELKTADGYRHYAGQSYTDMFTCAYCGEENETNGIYEKYLDRETTCAKCGKTQKIKDEK